MRRPFGDTGGAEARGRAVPRQPRPADKLAYPARAASTHRRLTSPGQARSAGPAQAPEARPSRPGRDGPGSGRATAGARMSWSSGDTGALMTIPPSTAVLPGGGSQPFSRNRGAMESKSRSGDQPCVTRDQNVIGLRPADWAHSVSRASAPLRPKVNGTQRAFVGSIHASPAIGSPRSPLSVPFRRDPPRTGTASRSVTPVPASSRGRDSRPPTATADFSVGSAAVGRRHHQRRN
jgi:hypothetical protein